MKTNYEIFNYIDDHCIYRCPPDTTLYGNLPGSMHTWSVCLRRLTHNPKMLADVCVSLGKEIARDMIGKSYQFVGLETSSIPLITGLQMELWNHYNIQINAFTVRKDRKHYGLFNLIEGIPNKHPVVFIDDTFNTGSTFAKAMYAVERELNLDTTNHMYCIMDLGKLNDKKIVNYTNTKGKEHKLFLTSLYNINQFNTKYDETKAWLPIDCEKLIKGKK